MGYAYYAQAKPDRSDEDLIDGINALKAAVVLRSIEDYIAFEKIAAGKRKTLNFSNQHFTREAARAEMDMILEFWRTDYLEMGFSKNAYQLMEIYKERRAQKWDGRRRERV